MIYARRAITMSERGTMQYMRRRLRVLSRASVNLKKLASPSCLLLKPLWLVPETPFTCAWHSCNVPRMMRQVSSSYSLLFPCLCLRVSFHHVNIIIIIQHKVVSRHHFENSDTNLEYLQLHRHPSKQWYTREELSLWVRAELCSTWGGSYESSLALAWTSSN